MAYCEAADYDYLPVAKSIAMSLREAHFHRMRSEAKPLRLFAKRHQPIRARKFIRAHCVGIKSRYTTARLNPPF